MTIVASTLEISQVLAVTVADRVSRDSKKDSFPMAPKLTTTERKKQKMAERLMVLSIVPLLLRAGVLSLTIHRNRTQVEAVFGFVNFLIVRYFELLP